MCEKEWPMIEVDHRLGFHKENTKLTYKLLMFCKNCKRLHIGIYSYGWEPRYDDKCPFCGFGYYALVNKGWTE